MRNLLFLILTLIAAATLGGCISDSFTTSSSDLLAFSEEKVSFDTVFTDVGTPTARLKVYNHAKKAINISEIAFRNPTSIFSLNVDGVSGTRFRDVEIRGGDSIFIFIECFVNPTTEAEPFLVSDQLDFLTNGVLQSVEVEAWGQNVIRLRGEEVTGTMTLTEERPYVVFDSLTVAPGGLLKIEPGARILFHDKARLTVHGRLEAIGEPGKLIQLRGDRLDNVLPDVAYDIMSGQWEGIRITRDSYGNRMEYVDMRSTVSGLRLDSCGNYGDTKITIVNSWLHNSRERVFDAPFCRTASYGVCFSDAAEEVVALRGGIHEMSQCTFANYYLFAYPSLPMLSFSHAVPAETELPEAPAEPLMKATVANSVFYGLSADLAPGDLTGSEVLIRRCSMRSSGNDDDNFLDCLWDCDPLFLTRREDYYFNYHVEENSPVIGQGDPQLTSPETLTDMDGVGRLENGAPTLGAYAR